MIREIYLWANGVLMVFNEKGEQILKFQGRFMEKREKLRKEDLSKAKFFFGSWTGGIVPMTKEEFLSSGWKKEKFVLSKLLSQEIRLNKEKMIKIGRELIENSRAFKSLGMKY